MNDLTDAERAVQAREYRPEFRTGLDRRLAELAIHSDLWPTPDAAVVGAAVADAARRWVRSLSPAALSYGVDALQPAVLPLANGWVQFEFYGPGERLLELEFGDGNRLHYLKWDPSAGAEDEGDIDRDDAAGVEQLIEWSKGD